jgi:hypothetical protein
VTIGKNLRIIIAGAATTLAVAPAAQACFFKPVDVCKQDVDVSALVAKYGKRLSASQKQQIVDAANKYIATKCGDPDDNSGPGNGQGNGPGYGV